MEDLWGSMVIPRWPDRIVSSDSPHALMVEAFGAAQLVAQRVVVDHVVAVRRGGGGGERRRDVEVGDPELRQIRYERRRLAKAEAGRQLHTIRRQRMTRHGEDIGTNVTVSSPAAMGFCVVEGAVTGAYDRHR